MMQNKMIWIGILALLVVYAAKSKKALAKRAPIKRPLLPAPTKSSSTPPKKAAPPTTKVSKGQAIPLSKAQQFKIYAAGTIDLTEAHAEELAELYIKRGGKNAQVKKLHSDMADDAVLKVALDGLQGDAIYNSARLDFMMSRYLKPAWAMAYKAGLRVPASYLVATRFLIWGEDELDEIAGTFQRWLKLSPATEQQAVLGLLAQWAKAKNAWPKLHLETLGQWVSNNPEMA